MSLRRNKLYCGKPRDRKVAAQFCIAVGIDKNANKILSQLAYLFIAESRVGHAVAESAPLGGEEKQTGHATLRGELATRVYVVHKIELSVPLDELRIDPGQDLGLGI